MTTRKETEAIRERIDNYTKWAITTQLKTGVMALAHLAFQKNVLINIRNPARGGK